MTEVRLQKFMAECGIASRRKCEEYISNSIESKYPSMAAKVAMRPEYEYCWEMISNDMKKAFHKALITEKKRQDSQPNIGDMIRNAIRGKPEEDGSKGWDSV